MKAVILVGGYGTRIGEETHLKPKPMVEIGEKPILWHIMKIYSHYGINDFILCLGYKGYKIKEYFSNYYLHNCDITFDLGTGDQVVLRDNTEPWRITLVDTGIDTMTGGRIKRIQKYVDKETFCLTYGDGVSDVNLGKLIDFHQDKGRYATLTAIQAAGRFGSLELESNIVTCFEEKPKGESSWINGGFFVLDPKIFDFIEDDTHTFWEKEPLQNLALKGQLAAFKHYGFWSPMDTLRDKLFLDKLWKSGEAPWKVWS